MAAAISSDGPFALHAGGHDQHVGPAPTPAQHLQEIANRRARRTGDDRNLPHERRQRFLSGGIEKPFPGEPFAQLPQGQFQRARRRAVRASG